ncbi:MAG TPA: helix-turn-helix transcriptional regulator [Thermoanaerobaculales bacterium]|nr:helix-turn-helix transcriptional regulator [Thermoanaerobaculales bacterium]
MTRNKIRRYRQKAGLTVTELSKRSDVSIRTLQRIEQGGGAHKVETLMKIYNAVRDAGRLNPMPSPEEVFPGIDVGV